MFNWFYRKSVKPPTMFVGYIIFRHMTPQYCMVYEVLVTSLIDDTTHQFEKDYHALRLNTLQKGPYVRDTKQEILDFLENTAQNIRNQNGGYQILTEIEQKNLADYMSCQFRYLIYIHPYSGERKEIEMYIKKTNIFFM